MTSSGSRIDTGNLLQASRDPVIDALANFSREARRKMASVNSWGKIGPILGSARKQAC